jgi:hypothetical protein
MVGLAASAVGSPATQGPHPGPTRTPGRPAPQPADEPARAKFSRPGGSRRGQMRATEAEYRAGLAQVGFGDDADRALAPAQHEELAVQEIGGGRDGV